jgi:hypothetical protein
VRKRRTGIGHDDEARTEAAASVPEKERSLAPFPKEREREREMGERL